MVEFSINAGEITQLRDVSAEKTRKKRSRNFLKSATADRDTQFEYSLFLSTMNFLICGRHRTISHHSAANEINGTVSWTN